MHMKYKATMPINEIKIFGNDRISKETILMFSDIQVKENLDSGNLNKSLKNLYDTNKSIALPIISFLVFLEHHYHVLFLLIHCLIYYLDRLKMTLMRANKLVGFYRVVMWLQLPC